MLKILALSLLMTNAFAGTLDTVCEQATKFEPSFTMGYVAHGVNPYKSVIESFDGKVISEAATQIRAIVADAGTIWALTPTQLVQINMQDGSAEFTHDVVGANSMVQFGRRLMITRGLGGIMTIDMDTHDLGWEMTDEDVWSGGITTDGAVLYVAAATSHDKGFTGILTIDPLTGNIMKRTSYDVQRWGVIDNYAKARMAGENLVLNNGGWIHLITKKQIQDDKAIRPRWVAEVVPASGQVNAHYMMMSGDFLIHDGQVMGCGVYTAEEDSRLVRKSKLVHLKLP
ncbi:MAG: hypothetical protein ACJ76H_13075 [Bacteriovoracaceae bacterium]